MYNSSILELFLQVRTEYLTMSATHYIEPLTQKILHALLDGKTIQTQDDDGWENIEPSQLLRVLAKIEDGEKWYVNNIRIKPDNIIVNGISVPAPITTAPPLYTLVYFPSIVSNGKFRSREWQGPSPFLSRLLGMGLLYLSSEDAIARSNAMTQFTQPT